MRHVRDNLDSNSKKIVFFLPNIFTALNMACGFAGVVLAIGGRYYEAALVLILGAIFDSVDGRLARLTGTQSSFGEQFDSMSDMISFGLAPSILMYQKYLHEFERLGVAVAFIYVLFAALRLARFNASINKVSSGHFQGLPSPGAALAIVGYILLADKYPVIEKFYWGPMVYTFFYGILMVTNIPFNSFKDSKWAHKHKRSMLFICFIIAILTFIYYRIMFAIGMLLYTLSSLVIYFKRRGEFENFFPWREEDEN